MVWTISLPCVGKNVILESFHSSSVFGSTSFASPHLVQHHPVGIDLHVSLRVQNNSLVLSEVSKRDLRVFGAHVYVVNNGVVVEILVAHVPHTVP